MKLFPCIAALFILGWTFQAAAATITIDQVNKKFVPGAIDIKVGDTLVFKNTEKRKRRHNVYSKTPGFEYVKIKSQVPGQSDSVKITNAGSFKISCAFHPKMKLMVNVTP